MKKIYLIHGWGGSDSSEGWFGWLKEKAKEKEFEVISFNMPNTDKPVIEEWVGFLKENVKDLDKETYFIGHSIGCQAVLRYLETLNSDIKVKGCIFVAPWMELDKNTIKEEGKEVVEIARPWMETPINFEKIKEHTNNFLCILSDNDPYVPLSNKEFFEEKLSAKTIIKSSEEHFNKTKEISEILDFISS
jgi:predicted alpha/beta hydrolase family esterase